MFKKESIDTSKTLGVSLILSMVIIIISFFILKIASLYKISLSEILFSSTEGIFLLISIYLGAGTFGEEKKQGSFEYLFSLKYSRWQLLRNKLIPRIIALSVLLGIYWVMLLIAAEPLFLRPSIFISLFFAVFLFFTSLSLLHENNTLSTIYNLIGFAIILGSIFLTAYFFTNMLRNGFDYKIIKLSLHLFTLLSVFLFIIFVLSFKNIDLENLSFGFMSKNLKRSALVFGILIFFFIMINQFDSSKIPNEFSKKDLLPASFGIDNGFYRFLTLFETEDVNIKSEKTINKYRFLFDPKFDKRSINIYWDIISFKKKSAPYAKILNQHIRSERSNWIEWPDGMPPKSWSKVLLSEKASIHKLVNKLDTLLINYQKLIDTSIFSDFSSPGSNKSLQNHSRWLRTISKIYISKQMLGCLEGNWPLEVTALLKQLDFNKRVIKESRSFFTNEMAKDSMRFTLRAIAEVMNQPECPKEVYKQVFDNMPDLSYEHYGSKNAIIADYLSFINFMQKGMKKKINNNLSNFLYRLFLQENRTGKQISKWTKDSLEFDHQQPLRSKILWEKLIKERISFIKPLWWLHNPSGKILIDEYWYPKIFISNRKAYLIRAIYDMTKISAELRSKYNYNKPVSTTLKSLKSFNNLMDPCSGKPYRYNGKSRVIYSIGMDLIDNNGKQRSEWGYEDIVLPLVLNNKDQIED